MICPDCHIDNPPQYDRCLTCDRLLVEPDPGFQDADTAIYNPYRDHNGQSARSENRLPAHETSSDSEVPARKAEVHSPAGDIRSRQAQSYYPEGPSGAAANQVSSRQNVLRSGMGDPADALATPHPVRRSKVIKAEHRAGVTQLLGMIVAVVVLLVSAGVTVFFLTKPPDDQRLYDQGQRELANGQYAFAVSTLTQASSLKPDDPKVFLSLARAYVGVDQVDKAWDCISHAQSLGSGVAAQPELASELANYYRQHGKFERAIELLRPLAKAEVPGKKAELADIDAAWGDDLLRDGKLEPALRCWEEVRDLREGARFSEAESRLATIYQRLANSLASKKDDVQALKYLSK